MLISGCGATGSVFYRPPFVPVRISFDTSGQFHIDADATIATEVGDFGVSGDVASNQVNAPEGGFLLWIQHLVGGDNKQAAFSIKEDDDQKIINIDDGQIVFTITGKVLNVDGRGHHSVLITSPHASSGGQTVSVVSQPPTPTAPDRQQTYPTPTDMPLQPPTSTSVPVPTSTQPPTPTLTPCWKDGGAGVTFYSGSNFTGQSFTIWHPASERSTITNLPSGIAGNLGSFYDTNNAWHVVTYQGTDGTGNLGHWDASVSSVDSYWHATQSVKVYLNGC